MGLTRWVGRWAGTGLWFVVLAPALALVPAAFLDRGPDGAVHPTLLPVALTALDPFVWDAVRNSVTLAAAVAAAAMVIGVGLARAMVRARFWGRPVLAAVGVAPLVIPSVVTALGLRLALGRLGMWPGVALTARTGLPADLGAWIGWFWTAMATAVPLVALTAASALARVEPGWEDAARLAGASRRRIWRTLIWPVIRPSVARGAGTAFTLTLIDPGAPLLLGLRRTLAFQLVESARGPGPTPRAAVLALAALGLAVAGQVLLGWWGGPPTPRAADPPRFRARQARWPRASALALFLGGWAVLAWLPALAVLRKGAAGRSIRAAWADPIASRLIANGAALGLAVVAIDLVLAWALHARAERRRGRTSSPALAAWPGWFPPLALGAGALVLPGLLMMAADGLRAGHGPERVVRGLEVLSEGLDPEVVPGLLLALSVAAVHFPFLARAVEVSRGRLRPILSDAAIGLGASPRAARRSSPGWLAGTGGPLLLTFALAATNLAPALLLAPTAESRPIAPGLLALADEPADGLARAATLASLAVAVNVSAFALASRTRLFGRLDTRIY